MGSPKKIDFPNMIGEVTRYWLFDNGNKNWRIWVNSHFFQEPISIFLPMVICSLLNLHRAHPLVSKPTLKSSLALL